ADSAEAALYEIWVRRLRIAFLQRDLRPDLVPIGERALTTRSMLRAIRERTPLDRAKLLLTTLHDAFTDAQKLLGDDPSTWRWGTLHVVRFRHGLEKRDEKFGRGPIERDGDGDTVCVTAA